VALKVIDLFCGCGGLSCGFTQEGFEVLAGVDINKQALTTFSHNFPQALAIPGDLSKLEPEWLRRNLNLEKGELDCLIGGPPCQGFSKNVPATLRSLDDPRNKLMEVYLSFVKEFNPKAILIENVAEVVKAYENTVSEDILVELGKLGYQAEVKALNIAEYGIPQLRRRAFFLASRVGPIKFPTASHTKDSPNKQLSFELFENTPKPFVSVWEAIGDLPSLESGEGQNPIKYQTFPQTEYQELMRNGDTLVYDHVARKLSPIQLERIKSLGEGEGMVNLPEHLRPLKGYSGAYGRLYPQEPARTITRWVFHPGSGRFGHPYDNRVITIREAARLQSFPDWFVFKGTYIKKSHQVGEAVPPLMGRKLARTISTTLRKCF
jgi:DNA (cytosine-5)-methyltransferase 1